MIFRALQKQCFAPILAKFSAPQANFKKKQTKKAVFGHFLKNFDKKIAFFFGARSPSKLVYIGAKSAFRKILGSVGQKWISEKVSKGGPFGSAGSRIPERRGVRHPAPPPPPPKSAPAIVLHKRSTNFFENCLYPFEKILDPPMLLSIICYRFFFVRK